jgi:hypothetical protein
MSVRLFACSIRLLARLYFSLFCALNTALLHLKLRSFFSIRSVSAERSSYSLSALWRSLARCHVMSARLFAQTQLFLFMPFYSYLFSILFLIYLYYISAPGGAKHRPAPLSALTK